MDPDTMDCSSVDVHQNEHPSQRPTNGGSQPYQYLTPPDNVIAASGPFAASTQQLEPLTPQDDPLSMYSFGVAQDPGGRDYQDDRYTCFSVQEGALRLTVAAILDGHHGHAISQLVTESLPHCFVTALARHKNGTNSNSIYIHTILSDTCRELEDLTYAAHMSNMNISTGGTTLLLLVLSPDQLWTASIGDCKGVVSSRGTPEVLNICHNPPVLSEQARFEAAGLRIYGDHVAGSDINVCRTLGDYDLGFPLKWRDAIEADPEGPLSSLPDISLRNIDPLDEFIIAATDGLWDYYGLDSTVVTEARKDLRRNRNDPQACAEFLIQQSLVKQRELLHEGTPGDNVTVMVVSLKKVPEIPKSSGSRLNLRGAGSGPLSGGFDNGGGSSGSGRYTVAGNGSGSHGGGGGVGGRLAPVMSSGESGESQLSFIEQEQQAV